MPMPSRMPNQTPSALSQQTTRQSLRAIETEPSVRTSHDITNLQGSDSGFLKATAMLDYAHPDIQRLLNENAWASLPERDRIGAVYHYVRDAIAFGYNVSDNLSASQVLRDGYGQCNTKGTLLMALLRASGIACRFHGFTIDKKLQKGVITGLAYWLAPRNIVHSWVEVAFEGRWVNLEGVILDKAYLCQLRQRFSKHEGAFCGFGVATKDLQRPLIEWNGSDTYIQRDGINQDLGTYSCPDHFYAKHNQELAGVKRWLFENVVRHLMNRTVNRIRSAG